MVKLGVLVPNFSTRNANNYTTKEEVYSNFNIPQEQLESEFMNLYHRIQNFDNTLIFGARGVGKTLYLKKVKFDYLYSNEGILPIYIDLTHIRELFKAMTKIGLDAVKKSNVFHYYLRFLIISEIISVYLIYLEEKSKDLLQRFEGLFKLIANTFGIPTPTKDMDKIKYQIQEIQSNLINPFDFTDLSAKAIVWKESITDFIKKPKFKDLMKQDYLKILQIISETSNNAKFLMIFDEFSMLSAETQNILAPIIIGLYENPVKGLVIKNKISIMEGRFHVNTDDYNFREHDFNELHFEKEFKGIFSGSTAELRLLNFYTNIVKHRISNNYRKKNIIGSNLLFEDQITFRNLCYFAGFKIRDFLANIHKICEANHESEIITNDMVYETCSKFYQRNLPTSVQEGSYVIIENYLRQLCKFLKKSQNKFYFISEDFNENYFQVLLYYKIISFVSYIQSSSDKTVDTRGFLIDLSTALQLGIITKEKIRTKNFKYLNFENARNYIYNTVNKRTEQIVISLLETKKLSDKQIMESVQIKREDFKKIKIKTNFARDYDSEKLLEEDSQVNEDEEFHNQVIELEELKFITFERAKMLVSKGVTRKIFMKWKEEDLIELKKKIPSNARGSVTKAFNHYHK